MKTCPKCNNQVDDTVKFCSVCGFELSKNVIDIGWITGIQEEIKEARHNRTGWLVTEFVGAIMIAINVIILVDIFEQGNETPIVYVLFLLLIFSFLCVVGGIIGYFYYNKKIKNLIQKLKEGK